MGYVMRYVSDGYCTYPGCGQRHRAKGLCNTHYHRLLRQGDPSVVLASGGAAVRWSYCEKGHPMIPENTAYRTGARAMEPRCLRCARAMSRLRSALARPGADPVAELRRYVRSLLPDDADLTDDEIEAAIRALPPERRKPGAVYRRVALLLEPVDV